MLSNYLIFLHISHFKALSLFISNILYILFNAMEWYNLLQKRNKMTQSIEILSWKEPQRDGNYLVFPEAFSVNGKKYDLRILRKNEGAEVPAGGPFAQPILQNIRRIAIVEMMRHIDLEKERIVYESGDAEFCKIEGKGDAPAEVLAAAKKIDALFHPDKRAGMTTLIYPKPFPQRQTAAPIATHAAAPVAAPAVAPVQAAEKSPLERRQFLAAIDEATVNDRFHPAVTLEQLFNYSMARDQEKKEPLETVYSAHQKVRAQPQIADSEAEKMRKWLEALNKQARALFPREDKLQLAKMLVGFIKSPGDPDPLAKFLATK
jgi:hypothetical protein